MDAIRIESLTKKYRDLVAVDSLSLSVGRGQLLSLLGVTGKEDLKWVTGMIHTKCRAGS